ncbi:ABC transporter substrate-binding protein [Paenibacillus mucilaginosus]|uniref:Putative ABC transporter substrate-binding protein n=1 Tax=Paenibacillus mucilaginosus (strain KNP414) TaxID=1036673 RepID=F8FJV1_PAEMK|nr:sugar ABC transporter substrate-binding protein [Paenibacillus mucilaginosus]AEI43432.1 putative ABC transporter substrate-binding protein [Paenibacillus mucilaginosus KNP414]MCG7212022.1 sugar ABC transporter substrate-binding protein [Paenibacillus mucilaginosus]WDM24991.1 sugar ABC transporter substrate-binding protein [Paenibacillus mucilaginosus]
MIKTRIPPLSLCLTLLLTSCSAWAPSGQEGPEAADVIELTFWDENPGESRTPYYEELFRRFEAAHPGIRVNYVGVPVSFNKQQYDVAIAANTMPDLAAVNAEWIADFAAKDALLPLDDYYAAWPGREEIPQPFIDYNRGLVPDEKLYQLPNTLYFDVLWYRADWFREAGVGAPESWDGFFERVRQLNRPELGQYGYSLRGGAGSITQLTSMLYAYSGQSAYFREDGTCTINDPRHLEFLKRYIGLYGQYTKNSDILNGYKEMVSAFDSGTAALISHNFGSYHDHMASLGGDRVGAALLPRAKDGSRVMVTVANGYSIFRSAKHPDAAWNLLQFLMSEESQTYWNAHVGQIPTNRRSLESGAFREPALIREALAALEDPKTVRLHMPYDLPNYAKAVKQQIEPNFQKVLTGELAPELFLDDWAALMERTYAQYHHEE